MKGSHVIFLLCIFGIIVGMSFYGIKQNDQIITLKNQIVQEKEKNKDYVLYDERINSMARTMMIAYSLSKWEAHYYAIIFDDFSKFFDIPWEIYPAVVRIESNFKCNVGSPKGAKGMMQLLEGTGREIAEEYGIDYVANQTLWNTAINLVLGCGYLSKNIKEKGLEGGVKSYLGGPDYLKSVRASKDANQYIGEYKSTVWKEYRQLSYIFRGIVNNVDIYDKIHTHKDTLPLNSELFVFTKVEHVKEIPKGENNVTREKRKKPIRVRPAEVSGTVDTSDTAGHP